MLTPESKSLPVPVGLAVVAVAGHTAPPPCNGSPDHPTHNKTEQHKQLGSAWILHR